MTEDITTWPWAARVAGRIAAVVGWPALWLAVGYIFGWPGWRTAGTILVPPVVVVASAFAIVQAAANWADGRANDKPWQAVAGVLFAVLMGACVVAMSASFVAEEW